MVVIVSEGEDLPFVEDLSELIPLSSVILFFRVYAFSGKNKKLLVWLVCQFIVSIRLENPFIERY